MKKNIKLTSKMVVFINYVGSMLILISPIGAWLFTSISIGALLKLSLLCVGTFLIMSFLGYKISTKYKSNGLMDDKEFINHNIANLERHDEQNTLVGFVKANSLMLYKYFSCQEKLEKDKAVEILSRSMDAFHEDAIRVLSELKKLDVLFSSSVADMKFKINYLTAEIEKIKTALPLLQTKGSNVAVDINGDRDINLKILHENHAHIIELKQSLTEYKPPMIPALKRLNSRQVLELSRSIEDVNKTRNEVRERIIILASALFDSLEIYLKKTDVDNTVANDNKI